MKKISVVIPVYNRITELRRALKSVLLQSFEDYELIVVDDHSNDNLTFDIRSAVAEISAYTPFRFLTTEGKGVSAARNTGIRAAQGEFIAFLDSDDEWLATKLEQQVNFLHTHPEFSIVHTNETWLRNHQPAKQSAKHKKSGGDIFINCTKLCVIAPSTVMLRKSLLDRVGLFDESFVVCEDFDLWLRITAKESVGFLPEALTIKHGGHADQLSLQHHSMDLWRLRALAKHINNEHLDDNKKSAVKESIIEKAEILLKGFKKHNNYAHLEEVEKYLKLSRTKI
jgi:glycosyltransferase involved in cell wall biosynthesis